MNTKAGKDFMDRNSINNFSPHGDKNTPDEVSRYFAENKLGYQGPDMIGELQQIDGHRYSTNVNSEGSDPNSRSSYLAQPQSKEEEQATKLRFSLGLNESGTLMHVDP